ncbi:hypothetical protein [Pelotalea chapellei]|uniref:Uncharacterized protein n=1 Tax=Pelotalea chapellei TaxID=44671 RepID=A0ABS5U3P8_9BACT|nr:hypothetical protein [Pelotalea chapellei]MBT1070292.1 hypothetical protein [Pelotalea chapellei]
MNTKKLSAGDIIDARCTRCKEVLNHRIVAMVEEKVVRVECNTCGGAHGYYPPPAPKAAKAPKKASTGSSSKSSGTSTRTSRKDPGEADRDEWAALRPNMESERAVAYTMDGKFRMNSLVNHSSFGLGVVKQLIPPNKMQVLFQDGMKLLRCQ